MSNSPLHDAVLSLDADAVAAALAAGGDAREEVPGRYRGSRPLLMVPCEDFCYNNYGRHAAVARLLLEAGADPNAPDSTGRRPLSAALHHAADPLARVLVEHGADIHALQEGAWAWPMLTVAAQAGLDWLVARCLAAGVDVQHTDGAQGSPLHGAYNQIPVIGGRFSLSAARRLLAAGAAVDAVNREGQTPLHLACRWVRDLDGVALLLDHGADIGLADGEGNLPVHLAAEFGEPALLTLLVARGADLEARNRRGLTPLLHTVARYGFSNLQSLLTAGADAKATGRKGESAISLWLAKNNRSAPISHWERTALLALLAAGVPADGTSSSRNGLLHRLAKGGDHDLIAQAAAACAPLNDPAKDGFAPLHNAALHADPATVAALLAAGADASVVTSRPRKLKGRAFPAGSTPREVAALLGNTATAALL
jgi:ankyrin repeat protein